MAIASQAHRVSQLEQADLSQSRVEELELARLRANAESSSTIERPAHEAVLEAEMTNRSAPAVDDPSSAVLGRSGELTAVGGGGRDGRGDDLVLIDSAEAALREMRQTEADVYALDARRQQQGAVENSAIDAEAKKLLTQLQQTQSRLDELRDDAFDLGDEGKLKLLNDSVRGAGKIRASVLAALETSGAQWVKVQEHRVAREFVRKLVSDAGEAWEPAHTDFRLVVASANATASDGTDTPEVAASVRERFARIRLERARQQRALVGSGKDRITHAIDSMLELMTLAEQAARQNIITTTRRDWARTLMVSTGRRPPC